MSQLNLLDNTINYSTYAMQFLSELTHILTTEKKLTKLLVNFKMR